MKRILNKIKIIVLAWVILELTFFSNSKYTESFTKISEGEIAEPIVILESFIEDEIHINKLDFPIEYKFKIKNYNDTKINEVDFNYNIEVILSNNNFPIKYEIIDMSENKKININNNISEIFKLSKQVKEEKIYKIIFYWEENNQMTDSLNFNIKVNLKQYKK